ncbi:MAG: hypothetical protein LIO94_03640, partial [Clostridiales bacterium]|nr:hypothetical protein [Clostridiales bacterium]
MKKQTKNQKITEAANTPKENKNRQRRVDNVIAALKNDKLCIFAIIYLIVLIAVSLLAPLLPLDPTTTDVTNMQAGISAAHWFGTDELGRDY